MDLAGVRDAHVWMRLQTLRLLLDVWGALTRAGPHQAKNGLGGAARCYALLCCHTLPTFNLVGTQPFFGAQGFQEKVCNKARAYLDCQTEHPCRHPKADMPPRYWGILFTLCVSLCLPPPFPGWCGRSWPAGMGVGEQASKQYARATIINGPLPPGDRLVLFTSSSHHG